MKKFIKFLISNAVLKELAKEMLLPLLNKYLDLFTIWLLSKLSVKFGHKLWFVDLRDYLIQLDIQDFFTDTKKDLDKIV